MYGRKILKPAFGKRIPLSDELIGSHWSAVIHSQDRDEAIRHWETAVSGQGDFLFEARLALRNGEVIWTRHNAALVTDHIPGSGRGKRAGTGHAQLHKISKAATVPVMVEGQRIALQLSIGVSIYPENGKTAKTLLKMADEAMYRIKSLKRQPADARSAVALAENQDNWPKEWCRRKTDVQFLS